MVPAAPSAKLMAATTARRCVFLDKDLPLSSPPATTPVAPALGRVRPCVPKSDNQCPSVRFDGSGSIPPERGVLRTPLTIGSEGGAQSAASAALKVGLGRIAADAIAGSGA